MVPIDYKTPDRPLLDRLTLIVFAILLLAMIAFALLFNSWKPSAPTSNWVPPPPREYCANNFVWIRGTLETYLAKNNGQLPDSLEVLFQHEFFPGECLVCSQTTDKPLDLDPNPSHPTTQISLKGHLSYTYLGSGLKLSDLTSTTVLLYEPLSNHAHDQQSGPGATFLFGDWRVAWLPQTEAQKIISTLPRQPLPQATSP